MDNASSFSPISPSSSPIPPNSNLNNVVNPLSSGTITLTNPRVVSGAGLYPPPPGNVTGLNGQPLPQVQVTQPSHYAQPVIVDTQQQIPTPQQQQQYQPPQQQVYYQPQPQQQQYQQPGFYPQQQPLPPGSQQLMQGQGISMSGPTNFTFNFQRVGKEVVIRVTFAGQVFEGRSSDFTDAQLLHYGYLQERCREVVQRALHEMEGQIANPEQVALRSVSPTGVEFERYDSSAGQPIVESWNGPILEQDASINPAMGTAMRSQSFTDAYMTAIFDGTHGTLAQQTANFQSKPPHSYQNLSQSQQYPSQQFQQPTYVQMPYQQQQQQQQQYTQTSQLPPQQQQPSTSGQYQQPYILDENQLPPPTQQQYVQMPPQQQQQRYPSQQQMPQRPSERDQYVQSQQFVQAQGRMRPPSAQEQLGQQALSQEHDQLIAQAADAYLMPKELKNRIGNELILGYKNRDAASRAREEVINGVVQALKRELGITQPSSQQVEDRIRQEAEYIVNQYKLDIFDEIYGKKDTQFKDNFKPSSGSDSKKNEVAQQAWQELKGRHDDLRENNLRLRAILRPQALSQQQYMQSQFVPPPPTTTRRQPQQQQQPFMPTSMQQQQQQQYIPQPQQQQQYPSQQSSQQRQYQEPLQFQQQPPQQQQYVQQPQQQQPNRLMTPSDFQRSQQSQPPTSLRNDESLYVQTPPSTNISEQSTMHRVDESELVVSSSGEAPFTLEELFSNEVPEDLKREIEEAVEEDNKASTKEESKDLVGAAYTKAATQVTKSLRAKYAHFTDDQKKLLVDLAIYMVKKIECDKLSSLKNRQDYLTKRLEESSTTMADKKRKIELAFNLVKRK